MRIVCHYETVDGEGRWTDLKTVNGYLRRLNKVFGESLKDFAIFSENNCGKVGRYLAVKSSDKPYWDYRVYEFRDRSELINHDLTLII